MANKFVLRVPFELPPRYKLKDLKELNEKTIDGHPISLEESARYHVITVEGFASEDEARQFLPEVWAGLQWYVLNKSCGLTVDTDFDTVVYTDDPEEAGKNLGLDEPVDGFANANRPVAFNREKNVRFLSIGSATALLSAPAEDAIDLIIEGACKPNSYELLEDGRFGVAVELYAAGFREASSRARLLTFVMALEALATGDPKADEVQELMDEWEEEIEMKKAEYNPNSRVFNDLEALERELLFRRESSLRTQIRQLVLTSLDDWARDERLKIADRAVEVYDARSTLVHEGHLPAPRLNTAASDAQEIAQAVLQARFANAAGTE